MMWWVAFFACGGGSSFIVDGTVVEVDAASLRVAPTEVPGVTSEPTSPFTVEDSGLVEGLRPGDRILGRSDVTESGHVMRKVRVVGHGVPPQ